VRIVDVYRRQRGVIEHGQLVEAGLGPRAIAHRVEALTLFVVTTRVYSPSPVITDDALRAAMVLSVRGRTILSHWSAAELLQMADRPSPEHHVTTMGHARSRPGLVIHRTRTAVPVVRVRGLPVTEEGVRAAAGAYPGHPGARHLSLIDPDAARNRRTESPLEAEALTKLDTLDLPPFICQYDLFGQSGRRYRADFFWREHGLLLETDGRSAHQRRKDMEKDRDRDNDLLAVGLRTMRVTRRQLRARTLAPQLRATLGV
jgi:very-short-patch-repair endonuclease